MVGGGDPLLPEILGQPKSLILNRYSLVAPHPRSHIYRSCMGHVTYF